jgi:hypothetical protein
MPRENEEDASKMLKLKSLETLNLIQIWKKQAETENGRQFISADVDGLLHYKINLAKWVKKCSVPRSEKVVHPYMKHSFKIIGKWKRH